MTNGGVSYAGTAGGPVSFQVQGRAVSPAGVSFRQPVSVASGFSPETFRPSSASTAAAFFSGRSAAPYQGNIRDLATGRVVSLLSPEGQRLLAAQKQISAQVARKEPQLAIAKGDAVTFKPDPSAPKYTPKSGVQLAFERAAIEVELEKLETQQSRIEKRQKSFVQRSTPFTQKIISEYNVDVSGIRGRIADYQTDIMISGFKESAIARKKRRMESLVRPASFFERPIVERIPLKRQFGLEAAETVKVGARLEKERRERALSGEFLGLTGKQALQKETVKEIEAKLGFSSEGVAGFLGPSVGEREALPIVKESLRIFERPGRAKVKLLFERGDILGAGISTAELIGRKGVEIIVPPGKKEFAGLGYFPKEATPVISAARGMFGLPTIDEGRYSLFGGTREELIQKGGLAGASLFEFALFDVGGRAAVKGLEKVRRPKRVVFKEPEIFLSLPAADTGAYTLRLQTKGVSRFENLKRFITGQQKVLPAVGVGAKAVKLKTVSRAESLKALLGKKVPAVDVTITGQKAAEWLRPTSELTFGARVSTVKGKEKVISELVTGAYPKAVTPKSFREAQRFLKTEAFTGKISLGKGKPIEFWQKGVPVETSLRVRTVYKPEQTEQFLKYYVDIAGEAAGKPYTGRLWQDIIAKTPVKGAKVTGVGRVGGVFKTEKGMTVELRKASIEFLQALPGKPPKISPRFVGKRPPLADVFGKESLLAKYPFYKRVGREVELIPSRVQRSVTVLQTRTTKELAPLLSGFKTPETVAPLVLRAAEKAKYVPPSYAGLAIPGSAVALAKGLPKRPMPDFVEEIEFAAPGRIAGLPVVKEFVPTIFAEPRPVTKRILKARQRIITREDIMAVQKISLKTQPISRVDVLARTGLGVRAIEKVSTKTAERVAQRFGFSTKLIPGLAVRVAARTRTAERQAERFVVPQMQAFVKPPRLKAPIIPFLFPLQPPIPRRKPPMEFLGGFIPVTRRAGKEVALTKFPVSKEAARAIAISEVIATPRASFKLLEAKGRPVKVAYPKLPFGVMEMFRPAKTLPGYFVEKMKFRIDQPQEFKKITYAGLEKLAKFPELRKSKKKKKKRGWLF